MSGKKLCLPGLLSQCKPCSVVVEKLKEDVIRRWTSSSKVSSSSLNLTSTVSTQTISLLGLNEGQTVYIKKEEEQRPEPITVDIIQDESSDESCTIIDDDSSTEIDEDDIEIIDIKPRIESLIKDDHFVPVPMRLPSPSLPSSTLSSSSLPPKQQSEPELKTVSTMKPSEPELKPESVSTPEPTPEPTLKAISVTFSKPVLEPVPEPVSEQILVPFIKFAPTPKPVSEIETVLGPESDLDTEPECEPEQDPLPNFESEQDPLPNFEPEQDPLLHIEPESVQELELSSSNLPPSPSLQLSLPSPLPLPLSLPALPPSSPLSALSTISSLSSSSTCESSNKPVNSVRRFSLYRQIHEEVGVIKNPFCHPTASLDDLTTLYCKKMSQEQSTSEQGSNLCQLANNHSPTIPNVIKASKSSEIALFKRTSKLNFCREELGSMKNPFASFRHPTTPIDELTLLYFKAISGSMPFEENEIESPEKLISQVLEETPLCEEEFVENKFLFLLESLND